MAQEWKEQMEVRLNKWSPFLMTSPRPTATQLFHIRAISLFLLSKDVALGREADVNSGVKSHINEQKVAWFLSWTVF